MNIAIAAGAMLVISSVFIVLGLGGGILFVPILHWAGFDLQAVAIPLGLLLNGTNTLLALIPYGRERLVDWKGGWPMALAAALTAPLGAFVQPRLEASTVLALFAVAVSLAAYRALRSARREREEADGRQSRAFAETHGGSWCRGGSRIYRRIAGDRRRFSSSRRPSWPWAIRRSGWRRPRRWW